MLYFVKSFETIIKIFTVRMPQVLQPAADKPLIKDPADNSSLNRPIFVWFR